MSGKIGDNPYRASGVVAAAAGGGGIEWCSTVKTANFCAAAGKGYLLNTTCGTFTATLPSSPSDGDIVAIKDLYRTAATNVITVGRGGSKMCGACACSNLDANGISVSLLYSGAAKGWTLINDDDTAQIGGTFIAATGGTITTCGNYKIHAFTGAGCFVVSAVGNAAGSSTVEYMVAAGGGGGGGDKGAGGGAGGLRTNIPSPDTAGLTVTASTYAIVIGGGGTAGTESPVARSGSGTVSSFSTITSAGGGGGGGPTSPTCNNKGLAGGSGGGARNAAGVPGSGDCPSVPCTQGYRGGAGGPGTSPIEGCMPNNNAGGGGGKMEQGEDATDRATNTKVCGGIGKAFTTAQVGPAGDTQPGGQYFSGGGGSGMGPVGGPPSCMNNGGCGGGGQGGSWPSPGGPVPGTSGCNGSDNTGGGGGGASDQCASGPPSRNGGAGGPGMVVVRYRFQ